MQQNIIKTKGGKKKRYRQWWVPFIYKSTFVHLSVRRGVRWLATQQSNCKGFECTCSSSVCFRRENTTWWSRTRHRRGTNVQISASSGHYVTVLFCADDWHDCGDIRSLFIMSSLDFLFQEWGKSSASNRSRTHIRCELFFFFFVYPVFSDEVCLIWSVRIQSIIGSNSARITVLPCWQRFTVGLQFLW